MRLIILHLSDIHFRSKGNPITSRVSQIASAVAAADPLSSACICIISGDIAFSGSAEEYEIANEFLKTLQDYLKTRMPALEVVFVCVPGNHDCVLPKSSIALRNALINGVLPTITTESPDTELLAQLLDAQKNYRKFYEDLCGQDLDLESQLYHERTIQVLGQTIQIRLYNTALLSRRSERQGELYLPVELFRKRASTQ